MSNLTLKAWKEAAAIQVTKLVPLQTFETSLSLVETYLNNAGGWNPDDASNPSGAGVPMNGDAPDEAAENIKNERFERVYILDLNAKLDIDFYRFTNNTVGMSMQELLATVQLKIDEFLATHFKDLPIRVNTTFDVSGSFVSGGVLTNAYRVELQSAINSGEKLINPLALALKRARINYMLDSTWNITSVYTENDRPFIVSIKKYTNTNYTTEDGTSTTEYKIGLEKNTYKLINGFKI